MKLEDIGFYTLSDRRCENVTSTSPMMRCEMILTDRCNFKCPYCRGLKNKGDMPLVEALDTLQQWCEQGLKAVRFSGGEPLTYPNLDVLIGYAHRHFVKHIAVSSNGSFPLSEYKRLIEVGVNDFSISLDACCSSAGDMMAGVAKAWDHVVSNIYELAKLTYVTVGVVLTDDNAPQIREIVEFAHGLGVADIRIIPAAQNGNMIDGLDIPQDILDAHPILKYRVEHLLAGRGVRGIEDYDTKRCFLPLDDSVVSGGYHYPCVIYMREQGEPIGKVGPNMRVERHAWSLLHDTHTDPICSKNCLDVCIDHNNKCAAYRGLNHAGT